MCVGDLVPWPDEASLGDVSTYRRGTILFHEGEPVRVTYLILSGVVSLTRRNADEQDILVAIRTAGWLLGAATAIRGLAQVQPRP